MSKQDPPWSRLEQAKRRLDASRAALKNGDSYRSAELTVMKYLEALRAIAPADGNALSPREREVLALIASGKSSRE